VQIADKLVELLQQNEPTLIYVNKWGTHTDYRDAYSPELNYDPFPLVASLPLDDKRKATVRDYHKALRWSVDGFFERVLPALRRTDAVLIYTSDHGQALFEGGYDIQHCSLTRDLARGEVLVPLFVVASSPVLRKTFQTEAKRAFNRASHFEIFPTLLELMGYSKAWVTATYGPGLMDVPIQRKRGFLMGTVFHPGTVWIEVD
jgi:glucan phosphoethanolaminetransferase (alkaline phosphatase superfamily)